MTNTTVFLSLFAPFKPLSLSLPSETPLSELTDIILERCPELPSTSVLRLSTHSGALTNLDEPVSSLCGEADFVSLRLTPRLLGGKGGFGSQLRAAGGRMSSQKTSNNDSCRDLSGRRLSTIKEANKLAEYLENEPARKKAAADAQKAKLEALERKLGIVPTSSEASSSKPATEADVLAGKKHRLDDTEYVEQSKELVEGVRSAVSSALLKKRKKAKKSHQAEKPPLAAETSEAHVPTVVTVIPPPASASVGA